MGRTPRGPVDYPRELAQYWAEELEWRDFADRLTCRPQFRTPIDGQTLHFAHVISPWTPSTWGG